MVFGRTFRIFLFILFCEGCRSYCLASKECFVDIGKDIILPCSINKINSSTASFNAKPIMWIKSGRQEQTDRLEILSNGSLSLKNVIKSDAGEYTCRLESYVPESDEIRRKRLDEKDDEILSTYQLIVRTPPPVLVNVTVHPSTVLALLLWEVYGTGGYDISYFSAQYRLKYDNTDKWHNVLPVHISPSARQIDIYRLNPNSTYTFQIWAANILGMGEITEIDGTTNHMTEEIELARHLLNGAENFDTRIWVIAVAVVMGTLVMLSAGTCYILCKEYSFTLFDGDEQEVIELMPNITLNPAFYDSEHQGNTLNEFQSDFSNNAAIKLIDDSYVHSAKL